MRMDGGFVRCGVGGGWLFQLKSRRDRAELHNLAVQERALLVVEAHAVDECPVARAQVADDDFRAENENLAVRLGNRVVADGERVVVAAPNRGLWQSQFVNAAAELFVCEYQLCHTISSVVRAP